MQSLFSVEKPPPTNAVRALTEALTPKPPLGGGVVMSAKRNADMAAAFDQTFSVLRDIAVAGGVELIKPEWNGNPYDAASDIVGQMKRGKFGFITFEEEYARFHWYETKRKEGWFMDEVRRERHEHLIVRPKFRRLPYKGTMPPHIRQIHDQIAAVKALRISTRILEGYLVGEHHSLDATWMADGVVTRKGKAIVEGMTKAATSAITSARRAANSTWHGMQRIASTAASGIQQMAIAAGEAMDGITAEIGAAGPRMLGAAVPSGFAWDPCIVIGNDLVLIGRKD